MPTTGRSCGHSRLPHFAEQICRVIVAICSFLVIGSISLLVLIATSLTRITGEREEIFTVLDPSIGDHKVNWGYLVLSNGLLIGSGTFDGAQYFGDQGEWYEGGSDHEAGKGTGEYIFVLDRNSGEVIWKHDAGVLINSTVTIYKQDRLPS